jgi:hypothetical protein
MRQFWIFWVFFFAVSGLRASSIDGQKVSFRRLMEEMTNDVADPPGENTIGYPVAYHAKKDFIVMRNVEIVFDRTLDNDLDQRFVTGGSPIIVRKGILFQNCIFPSQYWYLLRNVVFEDIVGFRQCKSIKAIFKDCTFKHHLYMSECEMNFAEFDSCSFQHGMEIGTNTKIEDHLTFKQCNFSMRPDWVRNPRVHEDQNVIKNLHAVPPLFMLLNRVDPFDLSIDQCSFHLDSSIQNRADFMVRLNSSQFNSLNFANCVADVPLNLSFTSVANQLSLHNCKLEGNVLAEAFNFNTGNAKVEWQSLAGDKIAIYDPDQKLILHGGNLQKFSSNFGFNTLISTYALFYSSYRQQGNRLSANDCYTEWKDVETAYLNFLYHKKPSFQIYFNWLMNVFLKVFCDYGTNPVKSMIWSFYVMVGFGLFYFFFPQHTGMRRRKSLYAQLHNYGKWLTEGKAVALIWQENHALDAASDQERAEFLQFLKEHKKKLPLYFRLSARSVRRQQSFSSRLQIAMLHVFDLSFGRLRAGTSAQKAIATFAFTTLLLFQLLVGLLIHLTDSLTTSLNAFSTLGFGEIPFQGLARYLAVIEGFIGWFLLSIFSVSLISQIIQ